MEDNQSGNFLKDPLVLKFPGWVLLISLVIVTIFDQLSWERQFGLQILIITLLILVALLALVRLEKKQLPWQSYTLILPILFGAVMTIIRRETSTILFSILLMLSSAILLTITLLNGQWLHYRIREVLMGSVLLALSAVVDPLLIFIARIKAFSNLQPEDKNTAWKKISPYVIGLLIAIPLLFLLGGLLASADVIFQAQLSHLFGWFKFENLFEFMFRATYITIFAYLLAGIFVHSLTRSVDKKKLTPDKPIITPFLGHIEAFIVLTLINLLFLGFIIIQFRYFFAGEANITLEGFTYADYARRGFFELVAVALISLGIYYLLSMLTERDGNLEKRAFSMLGILLIAQVGTMLISAFQRLSLYETAYGFTTLRTITHVFMVWLGALLGAAVWMEITNQFKQLALVLFMILLGFTLTLSVLNVDQFIAQRNVEHAIAQNPLDASYLVRQLSDDGLPILFEYWQSEDTPPDVREGLHAALACRYAIRKSNQTNSSWVEWHISVNRAESLFKTYQSSLEAYPFIERSETITYLDNGQELSGTNVDYYFELNGEEVWCRSEQLLVIGN